MKLITISKFAILTILLSSAFSVASYSQSASTQGQKLDVAELSQTIHDYILAHPEVVLESVRQFDVRAKVADKQKIRDKVHARLSELASNSPSVQSKEDSTSIVTVVEFFDYRCGFCKKVEDAVSGLTKTPGIRIVYKDLPILGSDSLVAAQAALAAEKQGGYKKLHNAMIASQEPLTPEAIDKLAVANGLDIIRLKKDMMSPEVNAEIASNLELAETLSIQATPTFVVGDQMVSGALTPQAFQALIDGARQKPTVASAHPPVIAGR